RAGAEEAMILSTCNRTEVYARGAAVADLSLFVNDLLREIKGMDLGARGHRLYAYREPDSVRHLFRVACGLNSQVLGEPQIVGQVKDALTLAARSGGSGPVTERLLDAALRCAKRARTETGIGRGPISSVYAAVNLAAMKIRKNRPLLLLDLAVPRDVDPLAARLPNVFLHDLDALAAIVAQSLEQRRAEVPKVETIIDDEVRRFMRWYGSLELKPTV